MSQPSLLKNEGEIPSKRLALIIGNADYEYLSSLTKVENDIENVKNKLSSLDFDVDSYVNKSLREMMLTIGKFKKQLSNSNYKTVDIVFYYAGHGCNIRGKNYLIPIDSEDSTDIFDPSMADNLYICVDWIIQHLASARPSIDIPIICILDCCRSKIAENDIHISLVKVDPPTTNILTMYATLINKEASDGKGFTDTLLKYMDMDIDIMEVATKVRNDLRKNGGQISQESGTLHGRYQFRLPLKERYRELKEREESEIRSLVEVYWVRMQEIKQEIRRLQLLAMEDPLRPIEYLNIVREFTNSSERY